MTLTHIYWYSVLVITLLSAFGFSTWAFSGGWRKYMSKAARWANTDPEGAQVVWGMGLILALIVMCFASFWGTPLYIAIALGYAVSKGARARNKTANTIGGSNRC